jgi:thiol-disulfide isomerase/thioredoxin
MDKPHEYEHIEWVNFNKLSIDPTILPGIQQSLKEKKAKINIVSYFAEWCPNCHYDAITLKNIYDEYSQYDLEMILVMNYANMEKSRKFIELYGLKMEMILGELHEKSEKDVDEILFSQFRKDLNDSRIWGTPFHLIIINGKIDNIGIVKGEFIKKEIIELLSDNFKETLAC